MLAKYPKLSRFASKLMYELLPAAAASAIGGMLYSHYAYPSGAPPAPTAIAAPASAEMMQMVRDEHALIVEYLKKNADARQQAEVAALDAWRMRALRRADKLSVREARVDGMGL